jgi:hypothetical protein
LALPDPLAAKRFDLMQTTRETTFAQHTGDVSLTAQQVAGMGVIASEEQHSDDRSSHDFCITHLTLRIFIFYGITKATILKPCDKIIGSGGKLLRDTLKTTGVFC